MNSILCCSDTHFNDSQQYPCKFEEDLAEFTSMYRDAVTNKVRAVFHLGDLLERNDKIHSYVYSQVFDVIRWSENNGVPTVILAGNHDLKVLNGYKQNALHPFGDPIMEGEVFDLKCSRSKVVWGTSICDINDRTEIMCVPYYKDANTLLASVDAMSIFKPCVMVGHFSGYEVDMNYSRFDLVLLGHEHKYSNVKGSVHQLGSFCQHSFADEGNGTGKFAMVNLPDTSYEQLTVEFHNNLGSRRFQTITVNNEDDLRDFVVDEANGTFDDYYVRPSSTSFKVDLKGKKLLENTSKTDITYLINTYVENNNKGRFQPGGLKQVGYSIIQTGGK